VSGVDVLAVVAAGPGLGRSVALRFAREGFAVGLLGRSAEGLGDRAAELRAAGAPRVEVAGGDAGDEESLRTAHGVLRSALGPPTVLVYNGSAFVQGSALTVTPDQLRLAVDVGVTGALVSAQEVAPAMREAGAGTILLTGSVAADRASTSAAAVGVAKAALRSLALSLHKELRPDGVRVVSVTIDGVLQGPDALDLDVVAERYWSLHTQEGPPDPVVTHPG
jgi:NAD(P)-dependent dehydrogenase (short-subunit alcohol dehydrogenase family)